MDCSTLFSNEHPWFFGVATMKNPCSFMFFFSLGGGEGGSFMFGPVTLAIYISQYAQIDQEYKYTVHSLS